MQTYSNGTYYTEKAPVNSMDLNPIPLNEEWLLKLGFEKYNRQDYFYKDWGSNGTEFVFYHMGYQKYSYQIGKSKTKVLEYVHQTQNVFHALTGEELTLKQ